jgi:hypothetical protein
MKGWDNDWRPLAYLASHVRFLFHLCLVAPKAFVFICRMWMVHMRIVPSLDYVPLGMCIEVGPPSFLGMPLGATYLKSS